MPTFILKLATSVGDRYLEWSTVVDSPVTYGMPRDEFERYYLEEYGRSSMKELPARLKRADATGCSVYGESLAQIIACNRAGADETSLTLDQIADWYCVKVGQGKQPRGKP